MVSKLLLLCGIVGAVDVDIYQTMESGGNGDLLTPETMNRSSHGGYGDVVATWQFGSGNGMWVSENHARSLPESVMIDGTNHSTSSNTRTWRFRNKEEMQYVRVSYSSNEWGAPYHDRTTVGCYFTTDQTTVAYTNQHDNIELSGNQSFAVLQTRNPNGGTNPEVRAHSCTEGWETTHSPQQITITPGKTYWVNLHYDGPAGEVKVAVFDPDNGFAQVGTSAIAESVPGSRVRSYANFGRCSSHGDWPDNETSSYFDHIMIDCSKGVFPLLPSASPPTPAQTRYWASPTGEASWSDSRSVDPLEGSAACTPATANANAKAGDTVYFREGTYPDSYINPRHSGTPDSGNIVFTAYGGESVTFTQANYGILLDGNAFVTVRGISFRNLDRFMYIRGASRYNTIRECSFDGRSAESGSWQGALIFENSTHNRILRCSFFRWAYNGHDDHDGGLLDIGAGGENSTDESNFNLVEGNEFAYGGHHTLAVYSKCNIIRNNYSHNETDSEQWDFAGYRNAISHGAQAGWNVYEGNRFAFSHEASSMSLRTPHNIVRFNLFYRNGHGGIQIATDNHTNNPRADSNHIYNNVFFENGHQATHAAFSGGVYFADWGRGDPFGNVVRNNIFQGNSGGPVTYSGVNEEQVVDNNWMGHDDPQFVFDGQAIDPRGERPDFGLRPNSPCIDSGWFLTTIVSPSGSGVEFSVVDAGYFTSGWGIIEGDRIQLQGQTPKARIAHVDYIANRITVDQSLKWTEGTGVALTYEGTRMDLGAQEHGASARAAGAPGPRPNAHIDCVLTLRRGSLVLTFRSMPSHASAIEVFDIVGRLVKEISSETRAPGNVLSWSPSEGLAAGHYLVQVRTNAGAAVGRLVPIH